MAFIEIDLHTDRFTAARLTTEDEKLSVEKDTFALGTEAFQRFLASLTTDDYVLIENTSNAFWFRDIVADRAKGCYVCNTNQLRTEANKNDKIDAERPSKKMGYYITIGSAAEDLPTVYVPDEKVREL